MSVVVSVSLSVVVGLVRRHKVVGLGGEVVVRAVVVRSFGGVGMGVGAVIVVLVVLVAHDGGGRVW